MSRAARAGERGFTLIELLVALTLLGLLMVALFGGLQLGARAWETTGERLEDTARLQLVQDFLRLRISEAYPLETADEAGPPGLAFTGEPDRLAFVTVLPRHLAAGLQVLTFRRVEQDGRAHLLLTWRPLSPDDQDEAEAPARERILLHDVTGLELAYFGAASAREPPAWHGFWQGAALRLPELIRLRVTFPEGDRRRWPDLVVRPMLDPLGF
jgi:general secretion pathway protein J